MHKLLNFCILLVFIFQGCVSTTLLQPIKKVLQLNKKIFKQEDTMIMFALRTEQIGDFKSAIKIFDELYAKTYRKEYLYRSLQNNLYLKEYKKVISRIEMLNIEEDYVLKRLKIISLIELYRLGEAQILALQLVEKSKEENDYILVSDIYIAQEKFDIAVKYLESAYLQNYQEYILDRMSIILFVNLQRKKDAIAQLETHTRIHGCSVLICKRLLSFYGNEDDIKGLLSTYLRYFRIYPDAKVAKKIVQLYEYQQEYIKLMLFLQESHSDDEILLRLYISSKNYEKTFPLARKLYEKTGKARFLAESVIYEYEGQKNKKSKEFLKNISIKFEELLAEDTNHLYLNYYGYILIEHNVDIKKGMEYVKKALKLEPNSAYYLDSLAWGYYKLGKCEESLLIIEKVVTLEGGDNQEVLNHHQEIKKCKGK